MVSKSFKRSVKHDLNLACHHSETGSQKQETKEKRSETSQRRAQSSRGQGPETNLRPGAKDQEPEARDQRPGTRNQKPEASNQRPETRNCPFIIPIFLPHAGCPHRCVFCDQRSITGSKKNLITAEEVRARVEVFLNYTRKQRKPVQIAFFGGNFLGQAPEVVEKMLAEATSFVRQGRADSIRFSTRPDTIDRRRLEMISAFPVSTIELGVQSMHDGVLAACRRGHTRADTREAVKLLKKSDYEIGLQIMVGLPGDDCEKNMQTGRLVSKLSPNFVRIYPTVVLNHSPLARWYQNGTYAPLPLEEAVRQVKDLFVLFSSSGITTIRMGLQSSENLDNPSTILAGPYHPAFGHLVYSEMYLDRVHSAIISAGTPGEQIFIYVHPHDVPKMRGLKNSNIDKLIAGYRFKKVTIIPDAALGEGDLKVEYSSSKGNAGP
jgi:radical SAM superfamily enzyme